MSSTQSGIFERRFIDHLRKLTRIYWTSSDNKKGAALLALCVAGELGTVYGNVQLAQAQAKVFDAVQACAAVVSIPEVMQGIEGAAGPTNAMTQCVGAREEVADYPVKLQGSAK